MVDPDQLDQPEQDPPMHWGTMLGWLALIIGRAHQRYRSGATSNDAIEHALELSEVVPSIEVAARVAWRMMTHPATDPAVQRIWLDAIEALTKIDRKVAQA